MLIDGSIFWTDKKILEVRIMFHILRSSDIISIAVIFIFCLPVSLEFFLCSYRSNLSQVIFKIDVMRNFKISYTKPAVSNSLLNRRKKKNLEKTFIAIMFQKIDFSLKHALCKRKSADWSFQQCPEVAVHNSFTKYLFWVIG